jgi:phage gpG-like protein
MSAILDFIKALNKIEGNIKEIPQGIRPYVEKYVQQNIDNIKEPELKPLTIRNKGSVLPLRDTGTLRGSISSVAESLKVVAGTNLKYAPIQHFGGEIKPKNAKKLIIPANKKIRKQTEVYGVKGVLKNYQRKGYEIVFFKNTIKGTETILAVKFKDKRKSKKGVLFIKKKKNKNEDEEKVNKTKRRKKEKEKKKKVFSDFKLLYIRKDKVKIPPRPFMHLTEQQQEKLVNIAFDILKKGV